MMSMNAVAKITSEKMTMKKSLLFIKTFFLMSTMLIMFTIRAQQNVSSIFIPHFDHISEIEFSPDGTKLAFISGFEIHILSTENWDTITVILDAYSSAITWHPDSELIAGAQGGRSEHILIWEANTGKLVQEFERIHHSPWHSGLTPQPQTISWHPSGNLIATDSSRPYGTLTLYSEEILFWDVTNIDVHEPRLVEVSTTTWHNSTHLIWSNNGDMLLSYGDDALPRNPRNYLTETKSYVLDVENNEVLFTLREAAISWSSDDTMLASINSYRQITIWSVSTQVAIAHSEQNDISILSVQWHPELPIIASLGLMGNIYIWNIETGLSYDTETTGLTNLRDLAWHPDGNALALAGSEGIIIQTYSLD